MQRRIIWEMFVPWRMEGLRTDVLFLLGFRSISVMGAPYESTVTATLLQELI